MLKDDEVLVRIHAASINSWDFEFLSGTPFINRLMFGLLRPKRNKQVLGADIAGTIEEVGERISRFKPGDEVFGDLWDNFGGFADYACAHEDSLELKPVNTTFEEAAAVPQAGVLALQSFRQGEKLQPGQKVLINGAGGGVGTFAIQLAKLAGAEVTGVDAAHKLDVVRSTGADHVLDYATTDFTKTGDKYDLIIDCQANKSMSDFRQALEPGGTVAIVGGPRVISLLIKSFFASLAGESRRIRLVSEGPNKGLDDLKELVATGALIPVIDKVFQFDELQKAMQYFEDGLHKGKIVVTMSCQ